MKTKNQSALKNSIVFNKNIHLLLGIFICTMLLSSCSQYQYVFLNSNLKKPDVPNFIHENDSLRIKYSFAGENCPVTIEVFNKLTTPVYVDWSKSAIIMNDTRLSLWSDKYNLNATSDGYEIKNKNSYSSSQGEISGTIYRNEQISFIPPQSKVRVSPISLRDNFLAINSQDSISKVYFATKEGVISTEKHSYNKNTTPLYFRCFLTYSNKEDFSSPFYSDNAFWASDVIQTMSKAITIQPDIFQIKRTTGVGKFMGCTTILGLLVILALLKD